MKYLKRIMCSIITACLTIVVATSSFAESYTKDEQIAIDKLGAIGVMTGTDNGFDGTSNLTRAQAAAIMIRLKGISEEVVEAEVKKKAGKFKDVKSDHWAFGYINLASAYGIVKGVDDNKYEPEKKVSISELITMATRSINAGSVAEESDKQWPDNYMDFANEEGFLDDIKSNADSSATRLETALIIEKVIEADTWKAGSFTTTSTGRKEKYVRQEGESLLKNTFKIDRYVDEEVESVSKSSKEVTFKKHDKSSKIDLNVPEVKVNTDKVDLSRVSKGKNVEVWYDRASEKLIMITEVEKGKNTLAKKSDFSYIESFSKSDNKVTLNINGKKSTYEIKINSGNKENVFGTYNDKEKTTEEIVEILDDLDSDKKLDKVAGRVTISGTKLKYIHFGDYEKVGVVNSTSDSKIYFEDDDDVIGTTAPSRENMSDEKTIVCNMQGKRLDFTAIKKGFVCKYYYDAADEVYHVMTYNKNVSGYVTERENNTITLDGEKYNVKCDGNYERPDKDDEIKIYLDKDNNVILYSGKEEIFTYLEDDEDTEMNSDDGEDDEDFDNNTNETVKTNYGIITKAYGTTSNGKKVLRLTIVDEDNKETTRYVDLEAMLTIFKNKFDDKSILQEEIIKKCVGSFTQYKVEESKFVLYQFGGYRYDGVKKRVVNSTSLKHQSSDDKIGNFKYGDKTKFYRVVISENSSLDVECSLDEITSDDLSRKNYSVSLYRDSSDKLDAVIIRTDTSNAEAVDLKGILVKYTEARDGIITLDIATGGNVKSYKVASSAVSTSSLKPGAYVDFVVIGNIITRVSVTMPEIKSENASGSIKVVKAKIRKIYPEVIELVYASGVDTFVAAKDLVMLNGRVSETDSKISISSLTKTTTAPSFISKTGGYSSSGTLVYCYTIRENGRDCVIAIVYR